MTESYDTARLANYGRDTARAYTAFVKAQDKLAREINLAIEEGVKPLKVAHDMMGRCPGHEAKVHLLSVIAALVELKKIPESVFEPFEQGIKPRRV